MTSLILDLSIVRRKWVHGDLTALTTWRLDTGKPIFVLHMTYQTRNRRGSRPCVVPIENAWVWDRNTGDGAHCAYSSANFCSVLGLAVNKKNMIRVTGIIHDHIGDLLEMPPMPRFETVNDGVGIVTDSDTGERREFDLRRRYVH